MTDPSWPPLPAGEERLEAPGHLYGAVSSAARFYHLRLWALGVWTRFKPGANTVEIPSWAAGSIVKRYDRDGRYIDTVDIALSRVKLRRGEHLVAWPEDERGRQAQQRDERGPRS